MHIIILSDIQRSAPRCHLIGSARSCAASATRSAAANGIRRRRSPRSRPIRSRKPMRLPTRSPGRYGILGRRARRSPASGRLSCTHGRGSRPVHARRHPQPHFRQDGAPPPAHLRRPAMAATACGKSSRPKNAASPDKSALAGVALALPALERAAKLQRRAAQTGFDWPDVSGPRAKVDEELAELDAGDRAPPQARGAPRPSVCGRQPRTPSECRTGNRASRSERKFERRFRAIEKERVSRISRWTRKKRFGPALKPIEQLIA